MENETAVLEWYEAASSLEDEKFEVLSERVKKFKGLKRVTTKSVSVFVRDVEAIAGKGLVNNLDTFCNDIDLDSLLGYKEKSKTDSEKKNVESPGGTEEPESTEDSSKDVPAKSTESTTEVQDTEMHVTQPLDSISVVETKGEQSEPQKEAENQEGTMCETEIEEVKTENDEGVESKEVSGKEEVMEEPSEESAEKKETSASATAGKASNQPKPNGKGEKRVRVQNVPYACSLDVVKGVFQQCGAVESAAPEGRGQFVITMKTPELAQQVIKKLDGFNLQRRPLRLSVYKAPRHLLSNPSPRQRFPAVPPRFAPYTRPPHPVSNYPTRSPGTVQYPSASPYLLSRTPSRQPARPMGPTASPSAAMLRYPDAQPYRNESPNNRMNNSPAMRMNRGGRMPAAVGPASPYGQQSNFGQNMPGYGQNMPAYAQSMASSGPSTPIYGQSMAGSGPSMPIYGQNMASSGPSMSTYGQIVSSAPGAPVYRPPATYPQPAAAMYQSPSGLGTMSAYGQPQGGVL
eukprot:GCRY01002139.1.p1 GENE.GCRY01002139.1~~GCRY01002139.1.p1  ORF type:complete len:543 (-),score=108.75 GCRY01002139.1:10-1557(-)